MVQRLDKYELRRAVGRGAAGTVYEAWDTVLARRVAIKTVRLSDKDELQIEELLTRFRQEAQVASRLSHPGVVGVHNYGEVDGVAFIDMDYVDGETLKAALERGQRLPMRRVVDIITEVLAALEYCHRKGIVHRDIKPANIMLSAEGGVKLADFGIARIENSELTIVGTVMGTPPYMSPEQFAADQAIDLHTDIWSTGVVLYEMLTGEQPFPGDTMATIRRDVAGKPFEPPSRRATGLPPALDQVLARALRKSAKDRYPSAGAFAAALREALPDVPATPLASGSERQSGGQTGGTYSGGVKIALIAGGVLSVAGVAAWLWFGTTETTSPVQPKPVAQMTPELKPTPRTQPNADPSPALPVQPGGVQDATPPRPAPPAQNAAGPGVTPPEPAPPAQTDVARDNASPRPGVVPQPEPEAPPSAPPSLAAQLAAIPCSAVSAQTGPFPGSTVYRGVVGSGTPRAALDNIVFSLPPDSVQVQTFPRSPALCQMAELVRANPGATDANGMRLAMFNGRTSLFVNDEVRMTLRMPDFDGEVRVDDLNVQGQVLHLMEAVFGVPPRRRAREQVGLGHNGGDRIGKVDPPFGAELVVAIVSSEPLFPAPRPPEEVPILYLPALETAVASLRGRGGRVAMDALVVTTSAR